MDNNTKKEAAAAEMELILDGKKIEVSKRPDGKTTAPKEIILVRKIPICDIEPLGRAFGTPVKEVAVYANRDEAWARSLDDESFEAVFEEGRRLNFSKVEKWYRWQEQTVQAINASGLDKNAVVQEVQRTMAQR